MSTSFGDAPESLITAKPRTRMESWQRKLLDLSLRNNLLNTRAKGKNQLELVTAGVAALEDALAEGVSFRISAMPESEWEKPEPPSAETLQKRATEIFRKRELLGVAPPAALERTLRGIHTAARREMEESGANTLYLACGFLRWAQKKSADGAPKQLRAPLLLLPVQLTRKRGREGYEFALSGVGEDAVVNSTLLELLKTEYGLQVPLPEGELPKDEAGLDVPRIFELVREAVSGMTDWAVEESCLLGMFSFAKYLMWRDLTERADELMQNDVVRQIAADDRTRFPEQVGFPELRTLDQDVDSHKVYTPLAADSSQLAAILAAARGKSFVLEGPPGTGKSQTIANMIAHCLGHGKTVLFVAEKAVALEVVQKRLERIGLGEFCLELHSRKTLSSAVMQQLRAAVEQLSAPPVDDEWSERVNTLNELRYELNSLPREMHCPRADGESLYNAVCRLAQEEDPDALPAAPKGCDPLELPREHKRELLRCAHRLAAHFKLLTPDDARAASDITPDACTPDWEENLQATLSLAATAAEELESAVAAVANLLGLPQEQAAAWRPTLLAAAQADAAAGDVTPLLPRRAGKALDALQRMVKLAQKYRELRGALSLPYPDSTPDEPELPHWLSDCKAALTKPWPLSWLGMRRLRKALQAQAMTRLEPDAPRDLQLLADMRRVKLELTQAQADAPDFLRAGIHTRELHLLTARRIAALLEGIRAEDETAAEDALRRRADARHDTRLARREEACRAALARVAALQKQLSPLLGGAERLMEECSAGRGAAWAEELLARRSAWRDITLWNKQAAEARALGAGAWVDALLSGELSADALEDAAAAALAHRKLKTATASIPLLRDFAPLLHEEKIRDFAAEDADLRGRTGRHIRNLLIRRAGSIAHHERETAVLQRELSKKRMHMPLRRLLAATPHITPLLKPCFLMSPLSVAQYLTSDSEPFDVVIFDEASQIPVWDAIGAIGRGRSVIVTGDSRQMPPTSFFSRSRAEESDTPDDAPGEQDLESILDECTACGVPKLHLTWHYRSKSESLIAFSNAHYYEGRMTTFPAPTLRDTALSLHPVDGVYESGATRRVNVPEARAVVDHVLATLRSPGFRYTEASSIGIVTFNAQQQKLISDMLEDACEADPSLEPFFAETNPEAVFVKNLENVQGDERGVIYFSTTYGRDAAGKLALNFGPLNLAGGERRLNVAITRARYAMHVFTSLRPGEIDLTRTHARGAADLRAFLEYADAPNRRRTPRDDDERDALAQRIAAELSDRGYKCRLGLGTSDYRVDIAVAHPDTPDAVLAGITLDGDTYCEAYTARDRDVVRPSTMHLLGWRMLHVWAIDWWRNPEKCINALLSRLEKLRELGPEPTAELPELTAPAAPADPQPAAPAPEAEEAGETPVAPYAPFTPSAKKKPSIEMTDRELAMLMLSIADTEAPMARELLHKRVEEAAPLPPARGLKQIEEQAAVIRRRLESIISRLQEHGLLFEHAECRPGEDEPLRVITTAEDAPPRPRTAADRDLLSIPPSELLASASRVQTHLKLLPACDEHLRAVCSALGLRFTRKANDYIKAIIRMTMTNDQ